MSSYLYSDINFDNLSGESVALVSDGQVFVSSIVTQQTLNNRNLNTNATEWIPVSIQSPEKLVITCDNEDGKSTWNCKVPRNVNVHFNLPLTSLLTGGPIRIDTLLSFHPKEQTLSTSKVKNALTNFTSVGTSSKIANKEKLANADTSAHNNILQELATSSSYHVSHEESLETKIMIGIRLGTIIFTSIFLYFWLWSMGIDGFFGIKTDACCFAFIRNCQYTMQSKGE